MRAKGPNTISSAARIERGHQESLLFVDFSMVRLGLLWQQATCGCWGSMQKGTLHFASLRPACVQIVHFHSQSSALPIMHGFFLHFCAFCIGKSRIISRLVPFPATLRSGGPAQAAFSSAAFSWVAVKELKLSYHNGYIL